MYYNGVRNGIRVSDYLDLVHSSMKQRYSIGNSAFSKDKEQARQLQIFFQDLKRAAQGKTTSNMFDPEIIQIILDNIPQTHFIRSNFNIKNLFGQGTSGQKGGLVFERQLGAVIEAVWNEVKEEDIQIDKKQILLGTSRGTTITAEELDLSDKAIQDFLEKTGTKTQRYIEREGQKTALKEYYLPEVDGKIDVRGYEINIRADASAKMLEIYNLLKDATFSAKSYSSMTYDQKKRMYIEAAGRSSLALGKSNILRSIYGALSEFEHDRTTAVSAIFAGYNDILNNNDNVAIHFYHLRFMYELMGTGFKYNGKSYGNVRFLIFNDPYGDIYVKSTGELLADIIQETLDGRSSWDSKITIPKQRFY